MLNEEYTNKIDDLHSHLETAKQQDDVPTEKIEEIQATLQEVIELPDLEHMERHASIVTLLEDAASHFEVSHPDLTAFIRTVISDLNALGI